MSFSFGKDKSIFKDYFCEPYQKMLKNNDIYYKLESVYVSKVGVICLALLLDMEIENKGSFTKITDPLTQKTIYIGYNINGQCLNMAMILEEEEQVLSAINTIAYTLPKITEEPETKGLSCPVDIFNYVFDKVEREIRNGGDFVMDKFVTLVNNGEAKLIKLRKEEYSEEKDIIYSAAERSLTDILYKRCFEGAFKIQRSAKFYTLVKNQLAEEFYLTGHAREQMVNFLGGPEVSGKTSGFWEYMRQIKRIRECPEMW